MRSRTGSSGRQDAENAGLERNTSERRGQSTRTSPGPGEPNAGGASCRPPESPRTAPCEPPAPGQNRPARLRAALSRAVAPAHHAAAGLLVIFAALLAVSTAAQAQTQTLTTFVSNTGETPESNANKILAQSFRTGNNVGGYTLSEVQILMAETADKITQVRDQTKQREQRTRQYGGVRVPVDPGGKQSQHLHD